MSPVMDTETHKELVARLAVERVELAMATKQGNYLRAAGIARWISDELVKANEQWKEGRP